MEVDEFLEEWNNASPYVHVQTSGSTGAPKPMLVEKRRMLNSARITCDFLKLKPGNTALLCMPLDFIAGKMMVVRSIERGLKLTSVVPSGHPLATVEEYIDFAAMVPLQVYNSLQVDEERQRLMRIGNLIIGGGAVDDLLAEELRLFPNAVWSTYGMTETLSHIAMRRLSGVGVSEWYTPFDSVAVGLSEEACLVIDAPEVCNERLVTNDIAELRQDDEAVRFRIIGRKDNTICSGGIKIQPEVVERQLRTYLTAPFLISKRRDAKYGEIAVLITEGDVDEAKKTCENMLPRFYRPRGYVHVDKIPMTATGKPARKEAEKLC